MNTLILDFVGIVADLDYKKMVEGLTLPQKFSALRFFLAIKNPNKLKELFNAYQKGLFDVNTFENIVSKGYPNISKVLPLVLQRLSTNLEINDDVINLVKEIKKKGTQVLLMSNTIPETEFVIMQNNLEKIFDGLILSTRVKSIKPENEIFKEAIQRYNINTSKTIMIDDSKKNLATAESFGIESIHCSNSYETCETLDAYLTYLDIYNNSNNNLNSI